jgi:glycerol-3-phosphate acyltransferase PlsX
MTRAGNRPVALDAMGGDHAPAATVQGAIEAAREHGVPVYLVGREALLRRELARHGGTPRGVEVVDAAEVVTMDDPPTAPARSKRNSSMSVAIRLVRDGRASAFVTAGNSGAAMVAAKLLLGAIPGVDRPALAASVPRRDHRTLIIDAGANVDCRAEHLEQFAVMGHFYAEEVMGVHRPRIGLLSIGEERGKGDRVTVKAYDLLERTGLNFVGNVVLKTSEGLGEMIYGLLRDHARRSPVSAIGLLIAKGALRALKRKADYAEVGGAPLLGVSGPCLVGHGRSSPKAIRNALRTAQTFGSHDVVGKITAKIAQLHGQGGM